MADQSQSDEGRTPGDDSARSSAFATAVESSPARLDVGRTGTRPPTAETLEFRADHAKARDAVLTQVSGETIEAAGLLEVSSLVDSQEEYLARPDLGRDVSEETTTFLREHCTTTPDVQIVVCDGLSSTAVEANVPDLLPALTAGLTERGFEVGTPVFVRFGRVNVMDAIGEELGAGSVVNLVGERPGLNTAESLSAYMTYDPQRGNPTSMKSVISNIHADGLPAVEAGAELVERVETMHEAGGSGVDYE